MPGAPDAAIGSIEARSRLVPGAALVVLMVYMVALGGNDLAEYSAVLGLVNGLCIAVLTIAVLRLPPSAFDAVDRAVVSALVLFALAGTLSAFPRQSLDATITAWSFATAFLVARAATRYERVRRFLVAALVCLSISLTLLTAVRWLVPFVEWWAATDWDIAPALNFEFVATPWGHRHDLALLLVMLYPAFWIGGPSRWRRTAACAVGIVLVAVVLVEASRAVWVAAAGATALLAIPPIATAVRHSRSLWLVSLGVVIVGGAFVVTGLGATFIDRALNLVTFEYRGAMWSAVARDWTHHLIAGNGPGSFPWVLQLTGYFDTNSHAPKHPDSSVVQMVAEGGLLGLAAMALIAIVVLPALLRLRSTPARWALLVFAFSCLAASPTDSGFLVVVAIAWAAFASPRAEQALPAVVGPRRVVRLASVACLVVIGAAMSLTWLGTLSYERAREAIEAGAFEEARSSLTMAMSVDPGMALYPRQRGTLGILDDRDASAIADLELAVRLNPADDLAWRTLAVARVESGDARGGLAALAKAVALQRSDPTNLLLSAAYLRQQQRADEASSLLAEAVEAWPQLVYAPAWSDQLPPGTTTVAIAEAGLARWKAGEPMPERRTDQGLWLSALVAQNDGMGEGRISGDDLDAALAAALR
jgi:O-antigen ligase